MFCYSDTGRAQPRIVRLLQCCSWVKDDMVVI